jgi:hypothetical protein
MSMELNEANPRDVIEKQFGLNIDFKVLPDMTSVVDNSEIPPSRKKIRSRRMGLWLFCRFGLMGGFGFFRRLGRL